MVRLKSKKDGDVSMNWNRAWRTFSESSALHLSVHPVFLCVQSLFKNCSTWFASLERGFQFAGTTSGVPCLSHWSLEVLGTAVQETKERRRREAEGLVWAFNALEHWLRTSFRVVRSRATSDTWPLNHRRCKANRRIMKCAMDFEMIAGKKWLSSCVRSAVQTNQALNFEVRRHYDLIWFAKPASTVLLRRGVACTRSWSTSPAFSDSLFRLCNMSMFCYNTSPE